MGIAHNGAAIGVFGAAIVISHSCTVIFAHLFPFIQFLSISNHVVFKLSMYNWVMWL